MSTDQIPNPKLLETPIARAAYSDRTAWLMAELSALAYEKFEGTDTDVHELAKLLTGLTDEAAILQRLLYLRQLLVKAGSADEAKLRAALSVFGFELVGIFNRGGTQAYLAKSQTQHLAVLAFRGTEKNMRDIKADINARFYTDTKGAKTHTGFQDAFAFVRDDIQSALATLAPQRLFVTGHSLGGALALVATRHLNADNIAACYTYGCPRVGNGEFFDKIKPPIYRIVNAADIVPRLPPAYLVEPVAFVARMIPLDIVSTKLAEWLDGVRGYVHRGDMRFLTGSTAPDHADLRVIQNLDVIHRAFRLGRRALGSFSTIYQDHGIDQYREKLRAYALRRTEKTADRN